MPLEFFNLCAYFQLCITLLAITLLKKMSNQTYCFVCCFIGKCFEKKMFELKFSWKYLNLCVHFQISTGNPKQSFRMCITFKIYFFYFCCINSKSKIAENVFKCVFKQKMLWAKISQHFQFFQ